ncbi:MAG: nitroreductase family protein [Dehalococcoidia bacterium]
MIEAVRRRVSVRTYAEQPVEREKQDRLIELMRNTETGVFGNRVRFELVDLSEMEKAELSGLGTYGFINGARMYLVSAVADKARAMEDVGYCFEKLILELTTMGLGTCWLGGTFKRAGFARRIDIAPEEVCPAVSPVGYPAKRRTMRERAIRRLAKAGTRKPWSDLFYHVDEPLTQDSAGAYSTALECVRLGPSASNNQPWRIFKERGADVFHFCLKRTAGYDKVFKGVDLQLIDMGIAMSHFELASLELGLSGGWEAADPGTGFGNLEYIVTWKGNSG